MVNGPRMGFATQSRDPGRDWRGAGWSLCAGGVEVAMGCFDIDRQSFLECLSIRLSHPELKADMSNARHRCQFIMEWYLHRQTSPTDDR